MLRVETDPNAAGMFRKYPPNVLSFINVHNVQPLVEHVSGTFNSLLTVDECRISIRKRYGFSYPTVFSQES